MFMGLMAAAVASVHAQTPEFMGSQAASEPVVTGAPYSAEAITTVKAILFDGTRIDRSVTAMLYRDSAGRVRREQTVVGLEVLDPGKSALSVITIVDTVAGELYTLHPATRTAYRLSIADMRRQQAGQPPPPAVSNLKEEALGTRDIEGLPAVGRRIVTTIPAGQVGNDRPIEISDERWESAELKVLLFSRHHDPRTGDVEYRLTKLRRGEPAADLFTVPRGYQIVKF
jgi:hypothetical protein